MKKALLGVLVVIVVAVAAAPYINGFLLEKILRSQLEKVNEDYASKMYGITFEIAKYERDFNASEIEWKIKMPPMKMFESIGDIVLVEKAKHGYLGVTSETNLDLNDWFTQFVSEELGGKNPLTVSSCYSPLGGMVSTVKLDRFELQGDEGVMVVKPGTFVVETDMSLKNFVTNAEFEGVSFPGEIDLSGITLASDVEMISSAIVDGESTFQIQNVAVNDEGKSIEISNFNVGYTSDFDSADNTLSIVVAYGADKVNADDKVVDDLHVNVGINRLDADGVESLNEVYTGMIKDMMAAMAQAEDNPEEVDAMVKQQMTVAGMRMVTEIEKLLKKGLQIQVTDLHFHLPEGDVDGNFEIGLKQDMTLASFMTLTQQPAELLNVFSMKSNVTLPEGLIDQQEQLLSPMMPGMPSGLFEKDGPKLVHSAETKDNKLYLNGKEFVLNF